jgi:hypothetical protein
MKSFVSFSITDLKAAAFDTAIKRGYVATETEIIGEFINDLIVEFYTEEVADNE